MAFRFSLEAIFHFRQSVEHQHELRLCAANQQVARVRHLIEQFDLRISDVRLRQSYQLVAGTTAAELRFALQCETALDQQREVLRLELLRLEKLRDEQQKLFQQARRERETLENLREHELGEYTRGATRRQQWQLDELFLLRTVQTEQHSTQRHRAGWSSQCILGARRWGRLE